MINYYDVILAVKSADNMDKIREIIERPEFNTSVITPMVKARQKQSAL